MLEDLQTGQERLSSDVAGIKANVAGIEANVANVAGIEANVAGIKANVAGIEAKVANVAGIEANVAGIKANVVGIEANVASIEAKVANVAGIEANVAGIEANMAGIKANVAGINTSIGNLSEQVAASRLISLCGSEYVTTMTLRDAGTISMYASTALATDQHHVTNFIIDTCLQETVILKTTRLYLESIPPVHDADWEQARAAATSSKDVAHLAAALEKLVATWPNVATCPPLLVGLRGIAVALAAGNKEAARRSLTNARSMQNPCLLLFSTASLGSQRLGEQVLELDMVGRTAVDVVRRHLEVEAVEVKTSSGGVDQVAKRARTLGAMLVLILSQGKQEDVATWHQKLIGSVYVINRRDAAAEPWLSIAVGRPGLRVVGSTQTDGVDITTFVL